MPTSPYATIHRYVLPDIIQLDRLGSAGGFSGAEIWKLQTRERHYCLRRWPTAHPTFEHLSWIHRVLLHAANNDCPFLAAPVRNTRGETITREDSGLWEVSHWMPGNASFHLDPNNTRLANMMRSLAKFHLASAQVSLDFTPSVNLNARIHQLKQLSPLLEQIAREKISNHSAAELFPEIENFRRQAVSHLNRLAAPLLRRLNYFEHQLFPVQPILRDIWHDHVLFTENQVTGFVDFGAMQMDNVAVDIARLLGSTIGVDPQQWTIALAAYEEMRRLSEFEKACLPWLDQSVILLGSVNWLKWIYVDRREFEDWHRVLVRLNFLRDRFEKLVI